MVALSITCTARIHALKPRLVKLLHHSTPRRQTTQDHLPQWRPPLRPGKLKAFDEALKFIREDSAELTEELEQFRAVYEAEKSKAEPNPALLARYDEKIRILEVQSKINLPEVRTAFKTGKYPFNEPVFRHLYEQRWRSEGMLDLLMERIYQMRVVPDLLPELHPNVDMHVRFGSIFGRPTLDQHRSDYVKAHIVEPGTFLTPFKTRRPPRIFCTALHTDVRLYTMVLVDPDVPDENNSTFQTYLHWMQPNIPLSASTPRAPINVNFMQYIPPHPQKGTPYHRYVLLLLPHKTPTEILNIPVPPNHERLGFNLREFADGYGLSLGQGGGAHMWREVWDESVSTIYRDVLLMPEPVYQRPHKPDPYANLKDKARRLLLV